MGHGEKASHQQLLNTNNQTNDGNNGFVQRFKTTARLFTSKVNSIVDKRAGYEEIPGDNHPESKSDNNNEQSYHGFQHTGR